MQGTLGTVRRAGPIVAGIVFASLATASPAQTPTKPAAHDPERIQIPGIENTFRLSPRLYSGGDPRGSTAFAALRALGIKTVVSVDGGVPDVETARNLGLRYVHIPIGYDGVPREQALKLVQAIRTLPGPVYVHCHHGKHRGPAAAAVCGIATEGWSGNEALAWMKAAGTSPDYQGLYDSARTFVAPSAEELARVGRSLPERAPVPDLVARMVQVDARWDRIKELEKAGFPSAPGSNSLDPPHEALQLVELFREALRLPEVKERGRDFVAALEAAERDAAQLETALRTLGKGPTPDARKAADAAFAAVGKRCTGCHARHRDNDTR
ncbi:MAG: hypothetical protein U0794_01770 [Isosphaeraceae bacterium]